MSDWYYEDTQDGSCGRPCTPDGCHESHLTGRYRIVGPDWEYEFGEPILKSETEAKILANAERLHRAAQHLKPFIEVHALTQWHGISNKLEADAAYVEFMTALDAIR